MTGQREGGRDGNADGGTGAMTGGGGMLSIDGKSQVLEQSHVITPNTDMSGMCCRTSKHWWNTHILLPLVLTLHGIYGLIWERSRWPLKELEKGQNNTDHVSKQELEREQHEGHHALKKGIGRKDKKQWTMVELNYFEQVNKEQQPIVGKSFEL
ncbi:hypothetical protein BC835DRAFT_1309777 [Cytidiella melzeri]|nr:hypothetical protein BC835DRAFT_1309777 [Cytidiella melzeri]